VKVCGPDFLYRREACPAPPNSAATCAGGTCGFACNAVFHRCQAPTGSDPRCAADDDPESCGSACRPCGTITGGSYACTAGQCAARCAAAGERPCGPACQGPRAVAIPPFTQDCPGAVQTCERREVATVPVTDCARALTVHLTMGPEHCALVMVEVFANGSSKGTMGPLDRGQSGSVAMGRFLAGTSVTVAVQATGLVGGCNAGSIGNWAATGSVDVEVSP
jgi:hypothetical protein